MNYRVQNIVRENTIVSIKVTATLAENGRKQDNQKGSAV